MPNTHPQPCPLKTNAGEHCVRVCGVGMGSACVLHALAPWRDDTGARGRDATAKMDDGDGGDHSISPASHPSIQSSATRQTPHTHTHAHTHTHTHTLCMWIPPQSRLLLPCPVYLNGSSALGQCGLPADECQRVADQHAMTAASTSSCPSAALAPPYRPQTQLSRWPTMWPPFAT
jgi:hypothetical protein